MKHFVLGLLAMLPICTHADIISTKNNGNIENVKVVSVAVDSVVYKQGDIRKAIASAEVEGVLYDNGKFITPPPARIVSTQSLAEDIDSWTQGNMEVQVGNLAIPIPKIVSKMKNKWGSKAALMKAQKKQQRTNQREELETIENSSSNTSDEGNW